MPRIIRNRLRKCPKRLQSIGLNASNEDLVVTLRNYQSEVHAWSQIKQVSFDANNKSMLILALTNGERKFKLVGVPFDTALNMKDPVADIVAAAT